MKVLEKKEWSKETKCPSCESLLLIEENDVYVVYDDEENDYYRASCPECNGSISLKKKDLNQQVKCLAYNRYLKYRYI